MASVDFTALVAEDTPDHLNDSCDAIGPIKNLLLLLSERDKDERQQPGKADSENRAFN